MRTLVNVCAKLQHKANKVLLTLEEDDVDAMLQTGALGERCGWCSVRIELGTSGYQ